VDRPFLLRKGTLLAHVFRKGLTLQSSAEYACSVQILFTDGMLMFSHFSIALCFNCTLCSMSPAKEEQTLHSDAFPPLRRLIGKSKMNSKQMSSENRRQKQKGTECPSSQSKGVYSAYDRQLTVSCPAKSVAMRRVARRIDAGGQANRSYKVRKGRHRSVQFYENGRTLYR